MIEIKLINGDCNSFMAGCKENEFSLAITDPPYGVGDTFIGYSSGVVKGNLQRKHKPMKWDDNIPTDKYFLELKRVAKKRIIWGANYFNCFDDGGGIVWYKNRGGNTLSQCEIASVSGMKRLDYVKLQVLTGFVADEDRIHPTQKTVKLYKWLLKNYAKPNDTILDTHGGSMSSVIACIDMGFSITCIELDEDYFKQAVERVQRHLNQSDMFRKEINLIIND